MGSMLGFGKVSGALYPLGVGLVVLWPVAGTAQSVILPDASLGEERSQVIQNFNGAPNEVIAGGAQRGANLFHSFEEFNIAEDRGAFFNSPAGLENIFSRVTGGNASNILGALGTTGVSAPDLYLMNPNGIVFGPNASLDLGGAFTATTADAIGFGQEEFSALIPGVPSDLLSVAPSAFFFNQVPGAIVNRAQGGTGDRRGLVNSGGVTLLGGDVVLEQGFVMTETGAIQVGGLAGPGIVELGSNGGLTFPTAVARSTVNIADGRLSTLAGGNLAVWADALQVSGSFIITSTPLAVRAGDIAIDATSVLLQENSFVSSIGLEGSSGDIGNITIITSNLEIQDSEITSSTFGAGKGGTIRINADESINLYDQASINAPTLGLGPGGTIIIDAERLSLIEGATIRTIIINNPGAVTARDGGDITIRASESITIDGQSPLIPLLVSSIISEVGEGNQGNGGDITVEAGTLTLTNGGRISTATLGSVGNAGNLTIRADEIDLSGAATFPDSPSFPGGGSVSGGLSSAVIMGVSTETMGGTVLIETRRLSLQDSASITASSAGGLGTAGSLIIRAIESIQIDGQTGPRNNRGAILSSGLFAELQTAAQGVGGNLSVETNRLRLLNGSVISTATFAEGDAGNLTIQANYLEVSGTDADGSSGVINTGVGSDALGNGGDLQVDADRLMLQDGGQILSATFGQGNAGNITVNSNRIDIIGNNSDTSIASSVAVSAVGNGGDINVRSNRLTLRSGGQIGASTRGQGNSGSLIIRANNILILDNSENLFSGFFTNVGETGIGNGGNQQIYADRLLVLNGTRISSATSGAGTAGDITIAADEVRIAGRDSGGFLSTVLAPVNLSGVGDGGDVTIQAEHLLLRDGGGIETSTLGQGDAGSIEVEADIVRLSGFSTIDDDITISSGLFAPASSEATGEGGDIRIRGDRLIVSDGASITATTDGSGSAGQIDIQLSDSILLDGAREDGFPSGIFARTRDTATGAGGDITMSADRLRLSNGAIIAAQTLNDFTGGDIAITADTIEAVSGGQITTSTAGAGPSGDISLSANNVITLTGQDPTFSDRQALRNNPEAAFPNEGPASGIYASTQRNASGSGGRIVLATPNLTLSDRAIISAQSDGSGTSGTITFNVTDILALTDSDIRTAATNSSGGDIRINTAQTTQNALTILDGDSDITTNSLGDGGNIIIGGAGIVAFDDSDIISSSGSADGGNITLATFFSETTPPGNAIDFDNNSQVDLDASGALASGTITTPDTSFLQNSLADLPEGILNTENLIANSCVVRNEDGSTFVITGSGGLPERPGNTSTEYATGAAQPVPGVEGWQPGDPIVEPQGVYQLPNGELLLSHSCQ